MEQAGGEPLMRWLLVLSLSDGYLGLFFGGQKTVFCLHCKILRRQNDSHCLGTCVENSQIFSVTDKQQPWAKGS